MFQKMRGKLNSVPESVKASVAYTVCSILQRCLSMITMPLFTRLLTQEQYGQYAVYSSWVTIFSIFITLNLAYGSFSKAMVTFREDRHGYIAAVQNISLVLAGLFLLIYLPLRNFWNGFLELPTWLVVLMVAEIVFQSSLLCWYGQRRFDYKYKGVVLVTLLISVISPIFAYLLVGMNEEKGYARIVGYSGITVLAGLASAIYYWIRGKGGLKKEHIRYALKFNIPLVPYYVSQVIFNQSDRIMVSHYSGMDKAAMYSVAYSLATLLLFVLNAINNSYVPWLYEKIEKGDTRENRPMATGIAVLMAFMLLGVIALAPEIILVMAGASYAEAAGVVPPVAISILLLFYSQLFINVEFYYEKKVALVWASVGSAVANIVLNAWLIPIYGFVAAGYTTLISYVLFALANYISLRKIAKDEGFALDYFDLRNLLLVLLAFCALSFTAFFLYDYAVIRFAVIAVVFLLLGIFRKKVIAFVKSVLFRK